MTCKIKLCCKVLEPLLQANNIPRTTRLKSALSVPAGFTAIQEYEAASDSTASIIRNCSPLLIICMRGLGSILTPSLVQVMLGKGMPETGQLMMATWLLITRGLDSTAASSITGGTADKIKTKA